MLTCNVAYAQFSAIFIADEHRQRTAATLSVAHTRIQCQSSFAAIYYYNNKCFWASSPPGGLNYSLHLPAFATICGIFWGYENCVFFQVVNMENVEQIALIAVVAEEGEGLMRDNFGWSFERPHVCASVSMCFLSTAMTGSKNNLTWLAKPSQSKPKTPAVGSCESPVPRHCWAVNEKSTWFHARPSGSPKAEALEASAPLVLPSPVSHAKPMCSKMARKAKRGERAQPRLKKLSLYH